MRSVPTVLSRSALLVSVAVLLGLSGCSEEPEPDCTFFPTPPGEVTEQPGLLKVGQQVVLFISPTPPEVDCGGDDAWPSAVTAEVDGPESAPVPSESHVGVRGAPATLRFTPEHPGPHHLLVSFSPVGGLHQLVLHAMRDRSAEVSRLILPVYCPTLDRTLPGAWVCGTDVVRGEAIERSFPGSLLAVAGEVLWVVSSGGLQRYVDTGTELRLEGSLSQAMGEGVFLLADREELVVLHGSALERFTFSGGTLNSTGATAWLRPAVQLGADGPSAVLLREGERLAVVTSTFVEGRQMVQVCPYQLLFGRFQATQAACSVLAGETAGFERTILWTRDPAVRLGTSGDQGRLLRWEWTGGRLVQQGAVSLGVHTRLLRPALVPPSPVPLVFSQKTMPLELPTFAVVSWSTQRQAIVFEHLDAEVNPPRVSTRFYWGGVVGPPGQVRMKIVMRPAP